MFARVISVNGWLFYDKVANFIMRKESFFKKTAYG